MAVWPPLSKRKNVISEIEVFNQFSTKGQVTKKIYFQLHEMGSQACNHSQQKSLIFAEKLYLQIISGKI